MPSEITPDGAILLIGARKRGEEWRPCARAKWMDMSGISTELSGAPGNAAPATHLRSASVERTRHLGALLGGLLAPGDVLLLQGELGAGKTALTQGIGAGMGIHGVINSPTFTILKAYAGSLTLYHFDLYRIEDPEEVYSLGFEDYFSGDGVCVVEWAERGESAATAAAPWPTSYLRVHMSADTAASAEGRVIVVVGVGPRGAELQTAWARAAAEES